MTLSEAPSLPAALQSQPAAANCSALRSGRYRIVVNDDPNTGAGGTEFATEVVTIDATALTITNPANEVATLTAAGSCRYTTPEGGSLIVTVPAC